MGKKKFVTLLLLAGCWSFIIAQQSAVYTNEYVDFQKALTLYNNQQYLASQSLFETIRRNIDDEAIESDCAYYIANCAVRLNQQNADQLVENFVEEYPTSTKRNTAYVDVGDYYFENAKYAYARKWYEKVDEDALARKERSKFYFQNGYAAFSVKDYTDAKKYLSRVENNAQYGSQAKYYIGFMAYEGDDYEQANQYFDQVSEEEKYKEKLSYYQADLNFKLGNFEKAIELAKEQLPTSDANEVSELNKIIGESYFNLEKYSDAIPYLTQYKGKKGKWNNTDYYQLGYAYYKQGDYEKAIGEFNKIVDGNNSVAQNAYYHLGESYVNLDKKQEALNAFRNASQMDFDLKIQEDAWLNYAKISYEIGNPYQSVPQVLTSYLDKYPKTQYLEEIEELLIDSYITSKNYGEAMKLLQGKKSFESKQAFQKVAFYRGIELYNEGKYQEAREMFSKSIKEPIDPVFVSRATYWKAETDYNLSNFEEALIGYKQFEQESASTSEKNNLDYNIAYTYFKLKNYARAADYFNQFLSKNADDRVRRNDAYLRLGDANFAVSNYNTAITAYEKAITIGEIDPDYAYFQKAMSYGFSGNNSRKNQELETFVKNQKKSKFRDDAIFELGNSYVKSGDTSKALQMYNLLQSDYPASAFVPNTMLREGLVYYNQGNNDSALSKFKTVAQKYPGTADANQAVSTARLIYIDEGRVDEYADWVKTLDYIEVTDADLDNTTYESAEKQYLENKPDNAIKLFNGYLNQFPRGLHALQSHFYLAQLYFQKGLTENAASHYDYVTKAPQSEFSEEALSRLSQIYLEQKDWNKAVPALERLEEEAQIPQNIVFAQSNLMKTNYQLEKYNQAVSYAEKVLSNATIDNKIKSDAHVIIARSAIKVEDESKAKQAYAEVEKVASGELMAEALYYNAYFKNQEGNYEASNTTVQKLAKDYSSYKYYSAKGLILMAKNYYALGDAFQATYILQSVIDNFTEFNDVVSEAQAELETIKEKEAKTNSSVQNQD